ncbi:conserved hypothetical protein [Trichinella spiralis]|nr:conserved hypothetical protein [Trichinella spiralis]
MCKYSMLDLPNMTNKFEEGSVRNAYLSLTEEEGQHQTVLFYMNTECRA